MSVLNSKFLPPAGGVDAISLLHKRAIFLLNHLECHEKFVVWFLEEAKRRRVPVKELLRLYRDSLSAYENGLDLVRKIYAYFPPETSKAEVEMIRCMRRMSGTEVESLLEQAREKVRK